MVNFKGFVDSKVRLENAKGDAAELPIVNGFTLGLKSRISVTRKLPIDGISLEYLSFVNELTEKKSPVFPLAT